MKAFIQTKYGGPEVLQLGEVEQPNLKEDHILIKVMANSANPADWHIIRGTPYFARLSFGLFKPSQKVPGADFAGIVEVVGEKVSGFKVGDHVFGESLKGGAFAEYISAPAKVCALMPKDSSFTEMASMPIAGLTALQALLTHGKLKEGESVLINGASGGVGHLTIQVAKSYGAQVTGVCSAKNVDFVKSLGADKVIAHDKQNIHEHAGKYHLVIDTHGNLNHADYKRMGERGVMIGFTSVGHMFSVLIKKIFKSFPLTIFTAEANTKDLETLAFLVQSRKVKPSVEKVYCYKEIPQAISYIEAMKTRGKVVMSWEQNSSR